jgi:hypothetical protein
MKAVVSCIIIVLAVIGAGVGIVAATTPTPGTGTLSGHVNPGGITNETIYILPGTLKMALLRIEACYGMTCPGDVRGEVNVPLQPGGTFSAALSPGTYSVFTGGPFESGGTFMCGGRQVTVVAGANSSIGVDCESVPVSQLGSNGGGYTVSGG